MSFYDFDDTTDLPSDIAASLNSTRAGTTNPVRGRMIELIEGAPGALRIKQILAVLYRAGKVEDFKVPKESTVRNWLTAAEKSGEISKPTRQSYAGKDYVASDDDLDDDEDEIEAVASGQVEVEDDPLADLA